MCASYHNTLFPQIDGGESPCISNIIGYLLAGRVWLLSVYIPMWEQPTSRTKNILIALHDSVQLIVDRRSAMLRRNVTLTVKTEAFGSESSFLLVESLRTQYWH